MSDSSQQSLDAALTKLRSDDVLTQNDGVQELIHFGTAAVPHLLRLITDASALRRAQTMYALSQISAGEAANAFLDGLNDSDERVRAYAASGLAGIGHPQALPAAIQTINDAPDQLHLDLTPSVFALSNMGISAASELITLLTSADQTTRLHAQRALEMIMAQRHGFVIGKGFPTTEAAEQAAAEWKKNGDYDYAVEPAASAAAVEKLRLWAGEQQ